MPCQCDVEPFTAIGRMPSLGLKVCTQAFADCFRHVGLFCPLQRLYARVGADILIWATVQPRPNAADQ